MHDTGAETPVLDLRSRDHYRLFAFVAIAATLFVIVFGAFVRATGSGAGCGSHWPLCNGTLVQTGVMQQKTVIEFTHRVTSGMLLLLIGFQFFWATRLFAKGSFQRRAAFLSLVAVILEALIGAFIVLLGYVEHDKSIDRVLSMSLHLVNTLFLVAALTCAALSVREAKARWLIPELEARRWQLLLLAGFAALGGLGAVAALGDTLFPPSSVMAGIISDFSSQSHAAERIRILHPLLAVAWVAAYAWWVAGVWEKRPFLKPLGKAVLHTCFLNLFLGVVNVLLLAPVWMQLLHLFVANLLWILFVSLLFSAASRWK